MDGFVVGQAFQPDTKRLRCIAHRGTPVRLESLTYDWFPTARRL